MSRTRNRRGPRSGGPPEDVPWIWIANDMLLSPTWAALSIGARRILDAFIAEHLSHGGRENGNLAVTYRQLEAQGATKADISRNLAELEACGFLMKTRQGLRLAGGGEPSRFALTWLPTHRGGPQEAPATDEWRHAMAKLRRAGILHVRHVRKWLRQEVKRRTRRGSEAAVGVDIEGAPQMRGEERLQMRGETSGKVVVLAPQMRSAAVGK